jgi:hypothetical protein
MSNLKLTQSLNSLWPSRFLKPYHLLDNGLNEITDTIKQIRLEETEPRPGDKRLAPVLYFERIKTPYLLSAKTDRDTLHNIFGVRTVGDLIGLRLTLYVTEWQQRTVLRIKPLRPAPPKPKPASETDDTPDTAPEADPILVAENGPAGEDGAKRHDNEASISDAPTEPVEPAPPDPTA